METDCGFQVLQGLFVCIALTEDDTVEANGITKIAIGVLFSQ